MNFDPIMPIVEAVLYEGYILYPYRPSSRKNRQRWTFGGIYPRSYFAATGGSDPCHMHTECLLEGAPDTRIDIRLRFLQPTAREVGKLPEPLAAWPHDREPTFERLPELSVDGKPYYDWQEAVEREVRVADGRLREWLDGGRELDFGFEARRDVVPLAGANGRIEGVLVHRGMAIRGQVRLVIKTIGEKLYRLSVHIENGTPMDPGRITNRDQASLYSFASTHTLFGTEDGVFVSLADPPEAYKDAAAACVNQGAWPTMAGEPGSRDRVLSSPITLDDYPEVAPESRGNFYDAAEIDELLTLEVLAMTDAEKREMAATDPRGAALLACTEALSGDDFMRLHGVLRRPRLVPEPSMALTTAEDTSPGSRVPGPDIDPLEPEPRAPRLAYYRNGSTELKVGDRVRINPNAGGDVMDIALTGKLAVIESIERDYDDRVHVAVCMDDDPGREWGMQRMPGHRFFFSPEEIEPADEDTAPRREAKA
ncbi:MAG: hypothetical protein ACREP2_13935 [Rhodanobacteraceae bacterium]